MKKVRTKNFKERLCEVLGEEIANNRLSAFGFNLKSDCNVVCDGFVCLDREWLYLAEDEIGRE